MITPQEIKEKTRRQFKEFLKTIALNGSSKDFFPLVIRGGQTKASGDLRENQKEIAALINASKEKTGKGWKIVFETVNTRSNGAQTVIRQIEIEKQKDFLDVTGYKKETEYFENSLGVIRSKIRDSDVDIQNWILSHLKELSDFENEKQNPGYWQKICECVNFLRRNKKSDLYIREIPVEVHTKFIEQNKNIIHSLITEEKITGTFESSHGLKEKPVLIRFRSLDETKPILPGGVKLDELSVTIENLKNLNPIFAQFSSIYFVENEMVFLTFPKVKDSACIWGHGYTATVLTQVEWLKDFKLIYFGDLDEHGFDILSKFRSGFPETKSLCMDTKTLEKFAQFRVASKIEKHIVPPQNLTESEAECLNELNRNPEKNRLEQERISQNWIKEQVETRWSL